MEFPGSSGGHGANMKAAAAKLIPKKLAAKRGWKKQPSKESFGSTASSEDYTRGRSPNSREPSNVDESVSTMQSDDNQDEDDARENTRHIPVDVEESVDDEDDLSRPTFPSTHPSQIGHLTTSSPMIQAEHLPETFDPRRDTLDFASSDPLRDPTGPPILRDTSSRRSKSPTGRIRDAFRGKPNPSDTQSAGSQIDVSDHESNSTLNQTSTELASEPGSKLASQTGASDAKLASPDQPRRRQTPAPLETSARPRTPSQSGSNAPVIVNTPPTPTDPRPQRDQTSPTTVSRNPNVVVSPSGNMISHRRARSGSGTSIGPSKLSSITLPPLTPTPENAVPSTPGAGFFSSVLSAAQNAATTLSTTITNTGIGPGGNRPGSNIPRDTEPGEDDRVEVESSIEHSRETNMGDKEPAVKTLGTGELSLSQLGILEPNNPTTPTPTSSKFTDLNGATRTRAESAPVDTTQAIGNADASSDGLGALVTSNEKAGTTPPASVYEGKSGIHRSASIRSAISRRRKRGSTGGTAGTGTAIGAAIAAANASVAHPNAAGSVPKLTGFAVASKKRNRDFHALFKSVPDDDYLIEDYSCALQKEILLHGRLYVSEGHLCFSSNIFGWVTTLVISFDEIVSVEKRSTALLFKNGLMITTLHAKHVFATFASRDSTYDLIVNIWKLGHPSLRSSLNGVSLDETGGDKTEKVDDVDVAAGSETVSGSEDEESDDGDDIYDEDQDDDDIPETTQATDMSLVETDGEKVVTRKASGAVAALGTAEKPDGNSASSGAADFPGPATHAPTDCGDTDTHFDIVTGDDIIPAPLGKVYDLVFGPASVTWMAKWLTVDQKCTDLQMEDKTGLTQDNKSRNYTYIKPLYAAVGPRQTKCIVVETIEQLDLEKSVNVIVTTQNPDVPSGNIFSVRTKYCLSWAENNSTHMTINCTIEWTGKSWLKGPIEKGAKDGQTEFCKDLFVSLKAAVASRSRSATLNGVLVKGKRKKIKGKLAHIAKEPIRGVADTSPAKTVDWGLLEPLHGILGPVLDIIKPVFTGNVVYGLLVGLLVASWFGFGFNGQPRSAGYGRDMGFIGYPERAVAYEEMWRHEESDLWDWLEERVGLHRMDEGAAPTRKRVVEPRTVEEKLREERMNDREVEEAIKVTEEKLRVLRSVMDRKKTVLGSDVRGKPTTKVPATER